MKNYIVFVHGIEQKELIKAGSLKSAEKKAHKKYPNAVKNDLYPITAIQCVYTEI